VLLVVVVTWLGGTGRAGGPVSRRPGEQPGWAGGPGEPAKGSRRS